MKNHDAALAIRDAGAVAGRVEDVESAALRELVASEREAVRRVADDRVGEPTRRATVWDPVESIRPLLWTIEAFGGFA